MPKTRSSDSPDFLKSAKKHFIHSVLCKIARIAQVIMFGYSNLKQVPSFRNLSIIYAGILRGFRNKIRFQSPS